MKKIRINELARELEVKAHEILDRLPELGVTEKKTHSSSIDEDVAIKLRRLYGFDVPELEPAEAEEPEAQEEAGPAEAAEPSPAPVTQAGPAVPAEAEAAPAAERPPVERPAAPAAPIRPPLAGGRPIHPPVAGAPRPAAPRSPRSTAAPAAPRRPAPPPARSRRPSSRRAVPFLLQPNRCRARRGPWAQRRAGPDSLRSASAVPVGQPGGSGRRLASRRPCAATPDDALRASAPRDRARPRRLGSPNRPRHPRARGALCRPPAGGPARGPAGGAAAARFGGQTEHSESRRSGCGERCQPGRAASRNSQAPGQHAGSRPAHLSRPHSPRPAHGGQAGSPPRSAHRPRRRTAPAASHFARPHRTGPGAAPVEQPRGRPGDKRPAPLAQPRERVEEEKILRPTRRQVEAGPPPINREITISEGITVKELSEKLDVKANLVIKKLLDRGIFATINQTLDSKLATEVAREFGASTATVSYEEEAMQAVEEAEDTKDLEKRAPVVTIMGHVDHGKTSLLDAIREANVAGREAGGITQHIGAYQVELNGRKIVFIDTPGHEAFTRMRARGAKVTDIVVLVVAADDGVMPQTLEAIDHARAAGVPIVVAINKIDKPDAQPERIKQQLSDRGLLAEDWGGDVVMVPVSAKTHQNLELLLEMILLVADMQDLKANPSRPAMGTVIEAQLDRGRGPVATVLVRNGTLRVGDFFICGAVFGKVRAMQNDRGAQIRKAEPSTPVEVLGLDSLPEAGDDFQVVTDTAKAKQIVNFRDQKAARSGARQIQPPHPRATAQADGSRRGQGTAHHHQDRRGRLGRSAHRDAAEALERQGEGARDPLRRGRHQRVATCCWPPPPTPSSSGSTCGRSATRRRWPSRRRWISACTPSFTTSPTRSSSP